MCSECMRKRVEAKGARKRRRTRLSRAASYFSSRRTNVDIDFRETGSEVAYQPP